MERPEHQLHHRANAQHRGADSHADETCFRNRGVNDAFVAPFIPKSFGHLIGTVVLSNFFAHQDDIGITSEFLIETFTKGFTVGENTRHGKLAE